MTMLVAALVGDEDDELWVGDNPYNRVRISWHWVQWSEKRTLPRDGWIIVWENWGEQVNEILGRKIVREMIAILCYMK